MSDSEDAEVGGYVKNFEAKVKQTQQWFIEWHHQAREEGILSLEAWLANNQAAKAEYPLLTEGLQWSIDGTDPEVLTRWLDNIGRQAQNNSEAFYVELVKQGLLQLGCGNKCLMDILMHTFDLDWKGRIL
jgi:flagellar motor component MotA